MDEVCALIEPETQLTHCMYRGSSGQLLAHLFDKCNDESDFFGLCK